ncbi:uncharacterized protein V1513DRAFT_385830 [Lipomyces chichibuensis]|uniref:uncharacterized protein n=1 Tax=Lipomyces chichibuensis TaxID=1546026 RepID=UPI0033439424
MSAKSNPTIAFFGATGGCANTCLVHCLLAGYDVSALARTASKLTSQLLAQGLTQETLDQHLTIIQGDATNVEDVKRTVVSDGTLVSFIISGVGGKGVLQKSLRRPFTLDNPDICASSIATLLNALKEVYAEIPSTATIKPLLVYVSSTGISNGPQDVPFWLRFLYRVLIAVPHADKRKMERTLKLHMDQPEASQHLFRGVVGVRASLLKGGIDYKAGKGWRNLRVGTEEKPAIGYTISRSDVGQWIFEEVVKKNGGEWVGKIATLTS